MLAIILTPWWYPKVIRKLNLFNNPMIIFYLKDTILFTVSSDQSYEAGQSSVDEIVTALAIIKQDQPGQYGSVD